MEPDAIGRLLDRYEAPLILFARQLCDAPEDAVQEAFLRLADLAREPGDPGAWLFRVVRNLAMDAARAAGRRRKHEARAAASSPAWFDPSPLDGPDPAEAQAALSSLPLEEREVIVAHIWGGLTFGQIGRATGASSSTAHRLYARGLQTLRERLGAPCPTRESS